MSGSFLDKARKNVGERKQYYAHAKEQGEKASKKREYPAFIGGSGDKKWAHGQYYFRVVTPEQDIGGEMLPQVVAMVSTHMNVKANDMQGPGVLCPRGTILSNGIPSFDRRGRPCVTSMSGEASEYNLGGGYCPICDYRSQLYKEAMQLKNAGDERQSKALQQVYRDMSPSHAYWMWLTPWEKGAKECKHPADLYSGGQQFLKGFSEIWSYANKDEMLSEIEEYGGYKFADVFDNDMIPEETREKFRAFLHQLEGNLVELVLDPFTGFPVEVSISEDAKDSTRNEYGTRLYLRAAHPVELTEECFKSERYGQVRSFQEIFDELYLPQYYAPEALEEALISYRKFKGLLTGNLTRTTVPSAGGQNTKPVEPVPGHEDVPLGGGVPETTADEDADLRALSDELDLPQDSSKGKADSDLEADIDAELEGL